MSWRFRRTFKVIPGLRLNLSKSGLSASIGGAPFTLNLGPHGAMGTASLPGTGISYRHHFGSPAPSGPVSDVPARFADPADPATPPRIPAMPPTPLSGPPIEEVRSASTELLTSESLKQLKNLMQMTFEEREDIFRELATARPQKVAGLSRYESWERGFLFKRIFKKTFRRRAADAETASAKVSELEQQLKLTTVATQIQIDKEQAEPYFRMRDDFASLGECAAIWDVKCHQATDKFRERTTAYMRVGRQRVPFRLDVCDLIEWEQQVPHLQNSKGGDIFLYPGFILYRAAKGAFSVIDYSDVKGAAALVSFQEEEGVPNDSKVIGQAWAKANKDGSPDRRFAENHQIPVAQYGELTLKSGTGLWEEFQFSNPEKLTRFMKSLDAFAVSFASSRHAPANGSPVVH